MLLVHVAFPPWPGRAREIVGPPGRRDPGGIPPGTHSRRGRLRAFTASGDRTLPRRPRLEPGENEGRQGRDDGDGDRRPARNPRAASLASPVPGRRGLEREGAEGDADAERELLGDAPTGWSRSSCRGSRRRHRRCALMLVNCSERKQPPTNRTIMISQCGVVGVNRPFAARKAAPTRAFQVSSRGSRICAGSCLARVFMNSAPDRRDEGEGAGLQRVEAEADLQHQRAAGTGWRRCRCGTAKPPKTLIAEGRDAQQAEVDQRDGACARAWTT